MRELKYAIKGRPVTVHVVEHEEDLDQFVAWAKRHPILSFDTETTGLDVYSRGFGLRLAQFGTPDEAWVIPAERGPTFEWYTRCTLRFAERLYVHNAAFDLQVCEKVLGLDLREMFAKTVDTSILSRLWDSRGVKDGGAGHTLEDLTRALICPQVADEVKGCITRMAAELRISKHEFFRSVALGHQGYCLYAGMDVILTSILAAKLPRMIPGSARKLIRYEHEVARICAEISVNGFQLDTDYTKALIERLEQEETWWLLKIEEYTDDDDFSIGSTEEVARVLLDAGWSEFGFTPTKRLKVDDALLNRAAEAGYEFAEWIRQAKKAAKWRKTWPQSFLRATDARGRVHASINTLQARTGRMSISGVPAQTLPSNDSLIRNCFVADEDEVIASVDYSAQELRVTAALSRDATMLRAFRDRLDLHQLTADAAGVGRKVGKMANFLTVYGGGWRALMEQGKVDEATARRVIKAFGDTYPGVASMAEKLTAEGRRHGFITTPTGRVLRIDRDRAYSAMNYQVQSTSRDITAAALIRLDAAGFTPHMRLPIHDEVLFSLPRAEADGLAAEAGQIMLHVINGLQIPTDPEVGRRTWGSLYEQVA